MNPIAKRIQEARRKAGLSEKELAKKCGLSAGYISQIESGKKIINENAAAAILAVFGETMETSYNAYLEEAEKPVGRIEPAKAPQKVMAPAPVQVEPTAQWAGALANIIRQYPVTDIRSGKMVAQKDLPVLNKKIEGIPWEKLHFFMASENAEGLRIRTGDILWAQDMKELQGEGIYLIEWQNRKQIFRIQKHYGQLILSMGTGDSKPATVDPKDIRIIGRCFRVEFAL